MIHAREDYNQAIGYYSYYMDKYSSNPSNIKHDEPVMLFRAKDALAPVILAKYADLLRLHNADLRMIQTVLAHEALMRKWQRINGCKIPDMPEELLRKIEI